MGEAAVRGRLTALGLTLHKNPAPRGQYPDDPQGGSGYRIEDRRDNTILAGEGYSMSLEDVEQFLDENERDQVGIEA